jgi:drug/metabolite transporter, DME family
VIGAQARQALGQHPFWGLFLVCLAGVLWGTIGTAVRLIHDDSGLAPLAIGAWRAAAAVVTLLVVCWVTGAVRTCIDLAREHPGTLTLVGVLTAAFQLLFFVAVVEAGVTVSTVVCLGFAPVLLHVLVSIRRRRPPSTSQMLTVAAALIGLLIVSLAGGVTEGARNPVLGVLAALASGGAYALGTLVVSPLSRERSTLAITTVTTCVAAVILLPGGLAVAALDGQALTTDDVQSWLLLVYLGVVTMALAYGLLFAGLRSTPSEAAVVATLIEPVTAVLIAAAVLGERLSPAGVLGSVLILTAIMSLGRGRRTVGPPPQ